MTLAGTRTARLGEILEPFEELLGDRPEPPILTLTERRGFVAQSERYNKRLASEDTSRYKIVRRYDVAFNPYLLWAGAIAQNVDWDEAIISPVYPTFRPRQGVDPRYVAHLLGSSFMRAEFDAVSFGSVPRRRRASVADFLAMTAPLPLLPEQRRIATLLDSADAIRRKRQQAINLVADLIQSLYLALVGPGSREHNRWPMVRVEQLADPKPGSIRTGPFGSALRHSEFVEEGIAVLGIDNAVQNRFAWFERRFIRPEKYAAMTRYTVRPGDVIITIMGTTGRSAVVPDDVPVTISTKHLATITVDRTRVHPEFLSNAIHRDPQVVGQLQARNRGAIMSGLNLGLIRSLEVRLPPVGAQERFAAAVNRVRALEARLSSSCDQADDLFRSLLQRAFSGEA